MSDNFRILLGNVFYTQRTPNSKVVLYNLIGEKIIATENVPKKCNEVLSLFEAMKLKPKIFFEYKCINNQVVITKIKTDEPQVKIPDFIDGLPVTGIGPHVIETQKTEQIILPETLEKLSEVSFVGATELKSIYIPKKIKTIPSDCFYGCENLIDINLSHIENIGNYSFLNTGLVKIDLNSATFIGVYAFKDCHKLKEVTLNNNLKGIRKQTFNGCTALESIKLPKYLEILSTGAFGHCNNLKFVEFNDKLVLINESCFEGCSKLKEFIAPKKLKSIGKSAFYNSGLEIVKLNEKLQSIDENAFIKCDNLNIANIANNTKLVLSKTFDFEKYDKIKFYEKEEIICNKER